MSSHHLHQVAPIYGHVNYLHSAVASVLRAHHGLLVSGVFVGILAVGGVGGWFAHAEGHSVPPKPIVGHAVQPSLDFAGTGLIGPYGFALP